MSAGSNNRPVPRHHAQSSILFVPNTVSPSSRSPPTPDPDLAPTVRDDPPSTSRIANAFLVRVLRGTPPRPRHLPFVDPKNQHQVRAEILSCSRTRRRAAAIAACEPAATPMISASSARRSLFTLSASRNAQHIRRSRSPSRCARSLREGSFAHSRLPWGGPAEGWPPPRRRAQRANRVLSVVSAADR